MLRKGDTLELNDTGNPSTVALCATPRAGIGGILDAATNLIYVGNGQYYDPTTGRFLTRGVNPESPNPYVPWNPLGAILGPLSLVSLVALRRRGKGNKNEPYFFLFIMLVVLPLSVGMACNIFGTPVQTQTPVQTSTPTPIEGPGTETGSGPSTPTPGTPTPVPPCENCGPTPAWLPEPFFITHYAIVLENDPYFTPGAGNIPIYKGQPGQIEWVTTPVYHFVVGNALSPTCDVNCVAWSVYVNGTGRLNDGRYLHTLADEALFPPDFTLNAVYEYLNQPPSACATYLQKDATIAVSADALISGRYFCGEQYQIEGYGDKIFTITDTGSFRDVAHFDIFGGEQFHDNFYAEYPDTGTYHRVAKVQR